MDSSQELRKPFVKFLVMPHEDRAASVKNGYYTTVDVDYISITPHGAEGKSEVVRPYADWLTMVRPNAMDKRDGDSSVASAGARFPQAWIDQIEAGYAAWKKGEELPTEGYPLKNWPVLTPSQLTSLIGVHILSIEQLAAAADDAVTQVFGGINLRERARQWIKNNEVSNGKLVAELEAAKQDAKNKQAQIDAMAERLKALETVKGK